MITLFDVSYKDCLSFYKEDITTEVPTKYCIIMEDNKATAYNIADLILVYTPRGELVVHTVRVYRNRYNPLYWLFLLISKKKYTSTEELGVRTNVTSKYFDVTMYKRWYLEWAKEL